MRSKLSTPPLYNLTNGLSEKIVTTRPAPMDGSDGDDDEASSKWVDVNDDNDDIATNAATNGSESNIVQANKEDKLARIDNLKNESNINHREGPDSKPTWKHAMLVIYQLCLELLQCTYTILQDSLQKCHETLSANRSLNPVSSHQHMNLFSAVLMVLGFAIAYQCGFNNGVTHINARLMPARGNMSEIEYFGQQAALNITDQEIAMVLHVRDFGLQDHIDYLIHDKQWEVIFNNDSTVSKHERSTFVEEVLDMLNGRFIVEAIVDKVYRHEGMLKLVRAEENFRGWLRGIWHERVDKAEKEL